MIYLKILEAINRLVWGVPALVLILGVGLYLTVGSKFAQFRLFPEAMRLFVRKLLFREGEDKGVSQFQALCTALAATVGTGNIVGVAGAIAIGGPGAIFWMWICALFGMVTKYAEASLAQYYRQRGREGNYFGGPMYMIEYGMGHRWRWLGCIYCFFGVIAAFGIGNATQINAVIDGLNSVLHVFGTEATMWRNLLFGTLFSVVLVMIQLGGAKRVGRLSELLVPFVSVAYILLCMGILIARATQIPTALRAIVMGAFSPKAATGGVIGSAFTSLRVGASRGVFTNEAGMGTASMAHASASVDHPAQQGLLGIVEVFLDTVVICTMTALAILCSGVYIPFGVDEGFVLTERAFSSVYGDWVSIPLTLFLCCFAFATMLGWGLYGLRCAQYLFGDGAWRAFVLLQGVVIIVSTLLKTDAVWLLSETVNGLMALPNLIALTVLMPRLKILTESFQKRSAHKERSRLVIHLQALKDP